MTDGKKLPSRTRRGHGVFRKTWDFVTGTWPGRISALVAFVPSVWAVWLIFDANFRPAWVSGELECHPSRFVIHATNSGGRVAHLSDATFQMKSRDRWHDLAWHDRSVSALASPVSGHPDLGPHESWPYEFRPGFEIYESSEIHGADCQFKVTLPYTSNAGRQVAEIRNCTCEL